MGTRKNKLKQLQLAITFYHARFTATEMRL